MIPDFKTYIGESVWADIHRRSNGYTVRKEDDINNLDGADFKEYLKSLYKPLNAYAIITYAGGSIAVPIIRNHINMCAWFHPKSDVSKINIHDDFINLVPGLLSKLQENFSTEKFTHGFYGIFPKDKGEITNKYFIEVIDFLLENIPDSSDYDKSIERIDNKS